MLLKFQAMAGVDTIKYRSWFVKLLRVKKARLSSGGHPEGQAPSCRLTTVRSSEAAGSPAEEQGTGDRLWHPLP